jgi:5'(3')-deoxyribonucleotidase
MVTCVAPYKIERPVWVKKRICIDIDGVVCEYDFPKIVKGFFGIDLSSQAIFAYDLADVLGVSPELINTMFKEQVYGKPNFTAGALDVLNEWESRGYELVIFSNRIKYMGEFALAKWLNDNHIPFTEIDGGKGEYDVHIDDSPGKLMSTNSRLKLLYSQPWNKRCLDITEQLIRVESWKEVSNYV